MNQLELFERRLIREKTARQEAERILEAKSWQLFEANEQLRQLNTTLAQQVATKVEELQLSEARYGQLIESVQDIIYKISPQGIFTFVNAVVKQYLGYEESELVGQHFSRLVAPSFRKRVLAFYQTMLADQQPNTYYEFPLRAKAGHIVWIGQTVRVIKQQDVIVELVAVARDITERKRTEVELAQARQAAEEARHTEKQFLANMSHEIRTPLNAILGFSTLLETTILDGEQTEFLTAIRIAGRNLLTIVNDILDISKIEAGMLILESIPFSLASVVASIRTMLEPAATAKGLWLAVHTDPALPAVVLGDPTRLSQILTNLLSNAIKFTRQGGVTLDIACEAEPVGSVAVRISVRDTGIGIAAEVVPHLFERFRQASDFTTRHYGGTGLGLNIVRSLTEMQGGQVSVSSTLGAGSCFSVVLHYPVSTPSLEAVDERSAWAATGTGLQTRILIVEDNPMNQRLVQQVLKRLGYSAQLADNGQQALTLVAAEAFDLILMDIQMPVMDGYTTTRHIRQVLHSQVPIIAMTAHALASEREQCLQVGMTDFVPKPFQVEELQRVLRKYTSSAASAVPLSQSLVTPGGAIADFSLATLGGTLANEPRLATELAGMFVGQTPGELTRLRQALQRGDLVTISQILHTQKVPLQLLGLTEAYRLLEAVEAWLGEKPQGSELASCLDAYLLQVEAELPVIRLWLSS